MRRWSHENNTFVERVSRLAGALVLAGAGMLLLTQLDSLRRYIGIRRMSARRHPPPPGTQRQAVPAAPRWGTAHWPLR